MRQYSAPSSPTRYDPVIVGSQNGDTSSTLKEYETQVLAMAVPNDETDDLQIDFSAKNHAFSLDNVSYITHKENGKFIVHSIFKSKNQRLSTNQYEATNV